MNESLNHSFKWFIQNEPIHLESKQVPVFMNESLNHWLMIHSNEPIHLESKQVPVFMNESFIPCQGKNLQIILIR